MQSTFKTGCWIAAIAAGLLFSAMPAQAQFRATTGNQQAAKSTNANPNLLRGSFARPVRQPMQTLKNTTRPGINNSFQGMNQQGFNPYGMNPYGMNSYGMNPYGMNSYGMNPYGMNPYGMNPYGNPYGMNPYGMMYPGYYGY